MTYLLRTHRPEGLDRLEAAASKLDALAVLIGEAENLDWTRDGLALLIGDIASDIADGITEVRSEAAKGRP